MPETFSNREFDPSLPFEKAEPIPSQWFTDPEVYKEMCEKIFLNSWQFVARSDQLVESGSRVTTNIVGVPVLLWRGQDGVLRAMHNVCEHQGSILERNEESFGPTITCHNHRATYRDTGHIHTMPECQNIESLKARGVCLRQYAVASWGPLVAVHLGSPQQSLTDLLSPLPERCAPVSNSLRFNKRFTYPMPYGIGQAIKNYLDFCSHCASVHKKTFSPRVDLQRRTYEIFPYGNVQHVPVKPGLSDNDVRAGDKDYYFFFPNFAFNSNGRGSFDTNRFVPLGPDRCVVINDTYDDGTVTRMDENNEFMNEVQEEDNNACDLLQEGNASPHFEQGFYSIPNDALIHQFHRMFALALSPHIEEQASQRLPLMRCCD